MVHGLTLAVIKVSGMEAFQQQTRPVENHTMTPTAGNRTSCPYSSISLSNTLFYQHSVYDLLI